jgi:hypothetical protein
LPFLQKYDWPEKTLAATNIIAFFPLLAGKKENCILLQITIIFTSLPFWEPAAPSLQAEREVSYGNGLKH